MGRIYQREIAVDGLPVYGRYTLYRRGDELLLHLLSILPIQRRGCAILEEATPVRNIEISIPNFHVSKITLKPSDEAVDFSVRDGATVFTVKEIRGHQLVVLEKA